MHGGRHAHLGQPCGHELEQRHLCGRVLHRDAVGAQVGIGLAPFERLRLGIVEVVDEDLLGQRERAAEAAAADVDSCAELGVDGFDELDRGGGSDGHGCSSERPSHDGAV